MTPHTESTPPSLKRTPLRPEVEGVVTRGGVHGSIQGRTVEGYVRGGVVGHHNEEACDCQGPWTIRGQPSEGGSRGAEATVGRDIAVPNLLYLR